MGTSRTFQEYYSVILEYIMGVPSGFFGCFCLIEFAWAAAMTTVHKSKPIIDKNIHKHPRRTTLVHFDPCGNTLEMHLK